MAKKNNNDFKSTFDNWGLNEENKKVHNYPEKGEEKENKNSEGFLPKIKLQGLFKKGNQVKLTPEEAKAARSIKEEVEVEFEEANKPTVDIFTSDDEIDFDALRAESVAKKPVRKTTTTKKPATSTTKRTTGKTTKKPATSTAKKTTTTATKKPATSTAKKTTTTATKKPATSTAKKTTTTATKKPATSSKSSSTKTSNNSSK